MMRLCVVECLHLRKAFRPGLEKHHSGNSTCTKILAMEVRWEVKVQESQRSLNSSKTVGRGKPLFSSSVQFCVFAHLVMRRPSLEVRKMPCYSFVQVFCSVAGTVRKEILGDPVLKYKLSPLGDSVSVSRLHLRK